MRPPYKDAFYNLPWIDEIIEIGNMGEGPAALARLGYQRSFQLTQNIKFFEFRQTDPQHSLIDTPLRTGQEIGIPNFNQKPVFLPTASEITNTNSIVQDTPTIAIESIAKSGQSWADQAAVDAILTKFPNHRILWLSNVGAPALPQVNNMLSYSRREVIMCLRAADIFFSVGSGFFCSSMALPTEWQPKRIVCLWIDEFYKYERRLAELMLHQSITWVHNHQELNECLTTL